MSANEAIHSSRSESGVRARLRRNWDTAILAGLAVVAAGAVFLNSWGWFTPDNQPQIYIAPGRALLASLSAWLPDPFLGAPNFNTGVAPVAAAMFVVRSLGAPAWVAVRIWRALLLVAAGWGAQRFYREIAEDHGAAPGRILAAVVYVANPYVVVTGATTPVLLPYALFPWMMLAIARSTLRPRSWRGPAAAALVFFLMAGINAGIVPLFLLLGVPCYLLYARLVDRISWSGFALVTAKCAVLFIAVSLYWLVPALLARGSGSTVAFTTERPDEVAASSSYSETSRLLGTWPLYGRQDERLFVPNASGYLTNPLVVVATFALPAAAALGAALSRARAKSLAALLLAVGLPVMVGTFPPHTPAPVGRVLSAFFERVPGGIAFRNTYKAGALVVLGFTLLIAMGADAVRGPARRWPGPLRTAALAAAALVLAAATYPVWTGRLYPARWRIPGYWLEAAGDLNEGDGRALFLPGQKDAAYRWGMRGPDDLNLSLLSRPSVLRATVSNGSLFQNNYLAAIEVPLHSKTHRLGALPLMARYLGARSILARNDLRWEEWNGSRPSVVAAHLDQPGLLPARSYGNLGEHTRAAADRSPEGDRDAALFPLDRYEVADPLPVVRAEPARGTVLIEGDNFAVPVLASLGFLDDGRPFRLLGSMDAAELEQALADGARIVLTDTNRRRRWSHHATGRSFTPTLPADESIDFPEYESLTLFPSHPEKQTVTELRGAASITASSSGSVFGPVPFGKPGAAFDEDPFTAWLTGDFGTAFGQWVQVRFEGHETISSLTLRPVLSGPVQVSSVRITFDDSTITADVAPTESVEVDLPQTETTSLRVEITGTRGAGINPVGFSEIEIGGARIEETQRSPLTHYRLASELDDAALRLLSLAPLDVVMTREQGPSPETDEERTLRREFALPQGRSFTFSASVTAGSGLPEPIIDRLSGIDAGIVARSSSHAFYSPNTRASMALDGNKDTAWVPAFEGVGSSIAIAFPPRRLDHIVVRQDTPQANSSAAFASKGTLSLDGGRPFPVDLGPDPVRIDFSPQRVQSLRLTIDEVGGLGGGIRISEIRIPGVRVPSTSEATELTACVPLFRMDGVLVEARFEGTAGDLANGRALSTTPCSHRPLSLSAGRHELSTTAGWLVDVLRLSSDDERLFAPEDLGPPVRVLSSSPTRYALEAGAASGPYYLVLGQGYDSRWRLSMDGKPLGGPILVDGYSVGWRIDDTSSHRFVAIYGPQRWLVLSLLGSLVALVAIFLYLLLSAGRAP